MVDSVRVLMKGKPQVQVFCLTSASLDFESLTDKLVAHEYGAPQRTQRLREKVRTLVRVVTAFNTIQISCTDYRVDGIGSCRIHLS